MARQTFSKALSEAIRTDPVLSPRKRRAETPRPMPLASIPAVAPESVPLAFPGQLTLDALRAALEAVPQSQRYSMERAVMTSAYQCVQPSTHWKDAIDIEICAASSNFAADVISHAIVFFTGTVPTITRSYTGGLCQWRFVADGYRNGPAGDH